MRWLLVAVLVLGAGCTWATVQGGERAHKPTTARVRVETDPPGATVVVDGVNVGSSPAWVLVDVDGPGLLRISKDGYIGEALNVRRDAKAPFPREVRVALTKDPNWKPRPRYCPEPSARIEALRPPGYVSPEEEDCVPLPSTSYAPRE